MMLKTILLVAAGTLLTRALPFIMLGNKELSPRLKAMIDQLPYATISLLVVYSLKDVSQTTFLPTLVALTVLLGVHLRKRNAILSILVSTIIYMIMVQV